jgi:hypothetical protein
MNGSTRALATYRTRYRGVTIDVEVDMEALGQLLAQRAVWTKRFQATACGNCVRVQADHDEARRAVEGRHPNPTEVPPGRRDLLT